MEPIPTALDRLFQRAFGDAEPSHLGTGWVSGVASVFGGVLSLLGVLCFYFPDLLTAPELRRHYPVPLLRTLLEVVLGTTVLLGFISLALRRRKVLGAVGMTLAATALGLGGASVPLPDTVESNFGLGAEWFVLNALLLVVLFVPLERAFPKNPLQTVFRPEWTTDGLHFLISHLLVQVLTWLVWAPATLLRNHVLPDGFTLGLGHLPLPIQCAGVLLIADFTQYWVHRAFHQSPWLWKFHAIHHSSVSMDWLAGSRLHIVDAVSVRAAVFTAIVLSGASQHAVVFYLAWVSLHAVFIHANFSASLKWLEPFLVTPRYHHFHHAAEPEAIDKNFAVHLPFLDSLFGTRFLPGHRWPSAYGLENVKPASGYLEQLFRPFVP